MSCRKGSVNGGPFAAHHGDAPKPERRTFRAGGDDPSRGCVRDDGSFDFKRREDWGYAHSYGYMAGWLGQDEVVAEKKRKKKLGTVDMEAPPILKDLKLADTIEKTARYIHKSDDATVFERVIQEKNKGKDGWDFLEDKGNGNDYYAFCRHCFEREVEPRPLAEKARKVKEDREIKMNNAKNNVFTAGNMPAEETEKIPVKEAVFKEGELMEVVGIKNKQDFNGNIVKIMSYDGQADRYEVKFEAGRYQGITAKMREENLMYSSVKIVTEEDKQMEEGEIPNGVSVEIRGLQSESARWMNGQKAIVICWDKDVERYEVRLEYNTTIKKVKADNLRVTLPEGWEEHYDEHLGRYYYLHVKDQKVTWKHPKCVNMKGKMSKVRENNIEDLEENQIEIDADRKVYEVDDQDEMEGGFNLLDLVAKVEEQEERKEAAEERGEDDLDSDDGMHAVKKKRKKRKKEVDGEQLLAKITKLIEHTLLRGRVTMHKDYSMLDGHFIAKDFDPILEQWVDNEEPHPDLLKATFEMMLSLLERGVTLMGQVVRSKLQLQEMNKVVDRITANETPAQVLEDAKWVSGLLKTM